MATAGKTGHTPDLTGSREAAITAKIERTE